MSSTAVPAFDAQPFSTKAAALFRAELITGPDSPLAELAANVLLFFQALAIVAVVAGMVWRIQKERAQLEGVATTLLTVAFIATIPLWSAQLLGATDVIATSIGFKAATAQATGATPIITDLWRLVEQWVPPGSPYLDVLETQAAKPPASGTEPDWALQAWNWARGVGAADASLLQGLWQAGSGGLRAGIVFGTCALAVCASSFVIMLTYLAELVRHVLLCGGFAVLPVFVAGFSLDAMRGQALRYAFGLASIAFWPVGWALANAVSHVLIEGAVSWMQSISAAALGLQSGVTPPALATAAPFVAWGALFLLFALSLGICGWMLFTIVYIPVLMSRAAAAGVGVWSGEIHSANPATIAVAPAFGKGGARPPAPAHRTPTLVVPRAVLAPALASRPALDRSSPPIARGDCAAVSLLTRTCGGPTFSSEAPASWLPHRNPGSRVVSPAPVPPRRAL